MITSDGGIRVTVRRPLAVDSTSRSFQAPRRPTQRVGAHARHQTLQTLPLYLYPNAYSGLTVRWYTTAPHEPINERLAQMPIMPFAACCLQYAGVLLP